MQAWIAILLATTAMGCQQLIPQVAHQPVVHNPFPQLSKVAVAPFFNLTTDASVDGRQFALAYFNELQLVPGFEVVPVGVVEKTIETYRISLDNPDQARKLAQILGVDAVVIGAVSDFSPYYPPRCAMQVEWYAVNPGFHPIPPGYGLPWGTPEEEFIPGPLVFEAEMALAKAQLRTQTPDCPMPPVMPPPQLPAAPELLAPPESAQPLESEAMRHESRSVVKGEVVKASANMPVETPPDWPTAQAFVPAPPCPKRAACIPSSEPVLRHTKTYNGHDANFTSALESYMFFRDDARFGGWQAYLQRSDDFIRFCCHLHIFEMLSARGGAGETRVVWRWSGIR